MKMTKAFIAFMTARNPWVAWCREKKKKNMVKIYFLKLLPKIFCEHQKVVFDQPSCKWTSSKGNDMFRYQLQHFSNDAFQSYYDLFQVNWLVQT